MQFENSLKDDVRTVSGQDGEQCLRKERLAERFPMRKACMTVRRCAWKTGNTSIWGPAGNSTAWERRKRNLQLLYSPDASQADQVIFGNKSWSSATNAGLVLADDYNDADPTHISGSIGPGNGDYGQTSHTRFRGLSKDGWNHLTMTVDREEGVYTTYVNGIPYETGKLAEAATLTSGQNYHIGAAPGGSYAGWTLPWIICASGTVC